MLAESLGGIFLWSMMPTLLARCYVWRRGQCWDNAPTELFPGTLKSEWAPRSGYDPNEVQTNMVRFFMYYNRTRLHCYKNYLSPVTMEQESA
ncbi:hypothetical protein C1Y35_14580 [Pseudomonas sp. GW456-L14]|nr:hypothetical protein C1Y35_14580 [Pseudomonas sp. GW456-L14]PMY57956.1 hypothetical protein C1Y34_08350 [Pseudomonas sp. GW456-L12]